MNDQKAIKWALVVIAACLVILTLAYVGPKVHDYLFPVHSGPVGL